MSDDRSQSNALLFAVSACLLVCAIILYLEWWRAGELDLLSRRVDTLGDKVKDVEHSTEEVIV